MAARLSIRASLAALWSIAASMGAAQAAEISVVVHDERDEAVTDAVVILTPASISGEPQAQAPHSGKNASYEIVQKDMRFTPHILVIPRGASVVFPNRDTVRHHVYSFSPAKRFELTLYGQDETRTVTFDQPGIVAIGCNIHDSMQAYIYVYEPRQEAKISEEGRATFRNIPGGEYTITVWHPRMKPHDAEMQRVVRVEASAAKVESIAIPLRPARRPVRASYH